MRAERAAIALSVGLSSPPDRRLRSLARSSWQQHWERALQEHIFHLRELPHGVRLQRPVWWQPGDAPPDRLHEEITHTSSPCTVPTAPAAPAAALVEDEPSGSGTTSCATRSSTCPTREGQNGDGAYSGAWVRSSDFALGCSTGSTGTGNGARHQQHHLARRLCCHPQTRHG